MLKAVPRGPSQATTRTRAGTARGQGLGFRSCGLGASVELQGVSSWVQEVVVQWLWVRVWGLGFRVLLGFRFLFVT